MGRAYAPPMLVTRHADEISRRFSLGEDAVLAGPVSRGEQGQIWRLTTSIGDFAVKESFEALSDTDVREEGDYQEAAHAAGVPAPAVMRTTDGRVLEDLDDAQVRVYEWVDLGEVDRTLDPFLVGQTVAAIHRVRFAGSRPIHPWYGYPVGPEQWDELVRILRERRAPFAERLAEYRDELVALEGLLEPQERSADVPPRPVGRQRSTYLRRSVRDRLGELWPSRPEPGARDGVVRVRYDDPRRARTLFDAYIEAGGPGRVVGPGISR